MSVLLSPCVIGLMSSVFLSISRVSTRALSRIYRRINACRCGGNSPSFTVIVIGTSIRLVPADTDMAILGLHLLFLIFRVVCSNKGLPISTSVRGTRGEVVTLPASYDHDQPVIALTWNKFDPNIQGTRIPVYMYSPNSNSSLPLGPFKHRATLNNNGSLTLRHLQKKDEGQYVMTTLIDAVGQQEHYVYLEVQIPPKVSVGQQSPLRVPVNMNITLNCTMEKSTNLQYNIYWLRNGVRPPPDWHVEYEDQNSYKSSLTITRLTREDAGNYTCVAQHGGSSQSDSLSLDVQYPAVITNISVPTMAFVGTTASLWCQADGNPAPEIRWYRPATNSSPIHTTDQWKSSSRLTLRELDMLDDGQYVCAATNRMGQWDRRYVQLTVLGVASPPTAVIGLNYAAAKPDIPVVHIVAQTESVCRKLPEIEANTLRCKVNSVLNRQKRPEDNLPKEEREALRSLKRDKSITILPADKGRSVVVLNKTDYHKKCRDLLDDTATYHKLGKRDPTTRYKKELVSVLQDIEKEGGINYITYRRLYPTTETPPKFYGLPKIHKPDTPLRPIVSSIGSITYNSARFLADTLSPLVGKSEHHIVNSQQFAELIKHRRVEEDEELCSFDVVSLFTSVPVNKALDIILRRLQEDSTLPQRSTMSPTQLRTLPSGGSGTSTTPTPNSRKPNAQEFIDHLNSLDPDIKFTSEKEQDRTLPFLDTLTTIQDDGSLRLSIYRKPTHTDQYLNFRSNHPLEHKLGVVKTLLHRADTIITDPHDRETEKQHIKQALKDCGYPKWAIDKATAPKPPQQNNRNPGTKERDKGRITLPYIKTVSEPLRRIFASHGISTCFKPTNTLRQLLVAPKDKTPREEKCGVVYHIPCQGTTRQGTCEEFYIGETERSLRTRFLEHKRPSSHSSEVSQHIHIESPGHTVSLDKVRILDTEQDYFMRAETATQPGSWADFSMIVGGAAGGAAVLLLIMLAWFVWSRRMKAKAGYGNQSLLILQGQSCYPENNAMIMVSEEGKTLSVKSFTGRR
ncbi:HMCN1 [Branchiostoma lanceolatum]|uniref:HMCN1 protein n=1 Tax=Branchiostoma lanceolatum TaxID=7740 RepID=A0A8J9YW02_BRALA|nr:HMCN1 [Branchiostoma lanceolatum]